MDTAADLVTSPGATRREVRFTTIAEALAEARRLAEAERRGAATYAGQWTVGQVLNHVAAWAEFPFDGYPLKVPWYIRAIMRPMKRRVLRTGLPAGRKIPNVPGGTLATERVPIDVGLPRFEAAFTRIGRSHTASSGKSMRYFSGLSGAGQ